MKKFLILLCIFAVVTLASAGITKGLKSKEAAPLDEFTIVTSFYPVYIATKNIANGVDGVKVVNMTENHSGCLHDYQLTTSDMRKLEDADVFVMNGGGMEGFIEEVAAKYPDLPVIDASEGIVLIGPAAGHHHEHGHDEEPEEYEHHHEANAHVWMDPVRYKKQIKTISKKLENLDKLNAKAYEKNQKAYEKKIDLIEEQLNALKDENHTEIITFHEAFSYLADYLGNDIVYCMDLDNESGLSAGEIAEVINEVKKHNVRALFTETANRDSIANNISAETNAKVYVLNSLTSDKDSLDAYINGMQKNINVLKGAFGK
ncbi:metal ABC transporter substrate-binding protein [[Clostridium] polysaccharolyticum]|uniref:Zinc transport system substrate-binding protein n=1 Tax=[Clostridium] polysaccharolyticum TaxID=29364 RepID=A0A1H9YMF8_9FIRM|nr:metal ABC transporter substrate-binding protein [[Clostridium] polysaccharolyticum]SES69791.1 zinc transport system substrate-binding protein [[Clostridium] polysaccharolyticum]